MTDARKSGRTLAFALIPLALATTGCEDATSPEPDLPLPDLTLLEVASGLGAPTHLTGRAGDSRLYVTTLTGPILVLENGVPRATPFLNMTARISRDGEQGLYGIAFHPNYNSNRFVYVSYTGLDGANLIDRYTVRADGNTADPATRKEILRVPQPSAIHNGGHLTFGEDGMLWISVGDGGADASSAQRTDNLLGSILRIDVDGGDPYAIPSDNPSISAVRSEVWAYGLRNPYRFSIDEETDRIYIADVGERDREEVNVVSSRNGGFNFGWNRTEGTLCFPPETQSCDTSGLTLPPYEYPHVRLDEENGGRSVIGGYVYRGSIEGLRGHYVHGDFIGWVQSFRFRDGAAEDVTRWNFQLEPNALILGMGQDGSNELYVLTHTGHVYRIVEVAGGTGG